MVFATPRENIAINISEIPVFYFDILLNKCRHQTTLNYFVKYKTWQIITFYTIMKALFSKSNINQNVFSQKYKNT